VREYQSFAFKAFLHLDMQPHATQKTINFQNHACWIIRQQRDSNVRSGQKPPESEAVTKGNLRSSALHDMDHQHPLNYSSIQRLHSPQISGRFITKVERCIPSTLQLARNSYLRRTLPDITSSIALAANAGQAGSGGVVMGKD
jgi:hypothetical protein